MPAGPRGHAPRVFSPARGVSSAGRAPALQAGGHRFDPGTLHLSQTLPGVGNVASRAGSQRYARPAGGGCRRAADRPTMPTRCGGGSLPPDGQPDAYRAMRMWRGRGRRRGEFLDAASCHCSHCRAATGSAFKAFAGIERGKLELRRGADGLLVTAPTRCTTRAAPSADRCSFRSSETASTSTWRWARWSTRRRYARRSTSSRPPRRPGSKSPTASRSTRSTVRPANPLLRGHLGGALGCAGHTAQAALRRICKLRVTGRSRCAPARARLTVEHLARAAPTRATPSATGCAGGCAP